MRTCSLLVVGAGVVGLSLARELLARGHTDILIIDKEPEPGRHASGRNSGVLHAGIYYAPDSLKARTCRAGHELLKAYCLERGLPLLPCGKVIVTTSETDEERLDGLFARATANGAKAALLDRKELAAHEPHAKTLRRALHSPETAVIEPRAVLDSFCADIRASGKAALSFGTRWLGLAGPRRVLTSEGEIGYERLINCAGAYADQVAHAFGLARDLALTPYLGGYKKLDSAKNHLVRGNIYPVPDPRNPFLGVHFTKSVRGEVYAGPTARPVFGREHYGGAAGIGAEAPAILLRNLRLMAANKAVREAAVAEVLKLLPGRFFEDAQKLLSGIAPSDLHPCAKAGIRPQLVRVSKAELVMDFHMERTADSLHVLNAISPAMTASMAFAKLLADQVEAL